VVNVLNWYYPQTLEEAAVLVQHDGVIPCGGGTMLLRSAMSKIRAVIDLGQLNLASFEANSQYTSLGASLTYSAAVEKTGSVQPDSIICRALDHAASTPLRNQITLGGSIAYAPPWSDLTGPLVALAADVELIGRLQGYFAVTDYLNKAELREKTLITAVRFANAPWESFYHRAVRTTFDLPSFTITILAEKSMHGKLQNIRIVLAGTRDRYQRLTDLEQHLIENQPHSRKLAGCLPDLTGCFTDKRLGSAELMARLASIELQRGLEKILREV
jgi:CO/xanthine dehydrogenase FAD-binding subunit